MHLRGFVLLLAFGVVVISHSTDGMSFDREHVIRRRDADPDVNYDDEVMADAAKGDDIQNDADLDEDNDDPEEPMGNIESRGEQYTLKVGQTVRLPCKMSRDDIVFQWFKNEELLFLGSTKTSPNPSLMLDNNSDLIIKNVKNEDVGVYKCSIPGTDQSIEHSVMVTMPAKIIDLHATSSGLVKEGQNVEITCNVEGIPPPVLIWSKQANNENVRLTEKDVDFTSNSIIVKNIRGDQGGHYFCYADNKMGAKPDAKSIHIVVVGKPSVHVNKKVINTKAGVEAVLQCTAHRKPESHIKWYKDNRPVADVENLFTISTSGQSSNLTIIPRVDKDFGTYTCIAENEYGKHEKSIMLVQRPTIDDIDSDGPKLSWTIQSHLPLKKIELQIGSKNGSSTQTIDLPVPEPVLNKPHEYHLTHEVTNAESGNYWAVIRASNEHGWSEDGHSEVEIAMSEPIIHGAAFGGRGAADSVRPASVFLSSALMYILIRFF